MNDDEPLYSDVIIDHYTGCEGGTMKSVSIRSEYEYELARTNWRTGMKEELSRHHDRTFKCKVCGKVWAQELYPGETAYCPDCEEKHEPA